MTSRHIINTIIYLIVGIPTGLVFLYFGYMAFLVVKYPPPNCDNANPVFESNPYDSDVYKAELIKLLKETEGEDTKFWFKQYIDSNHIAVTIQNDKICATGHITVNQWEGFMKHLREVEGKSYAGALVGFEYTFFDEKHNPEIVLSGVQDIID